MFKSTPTQMKDFIEGLVWRDISEELDVWIAEVQDSLSDPDGPKDIETISTMRGIVQACKNFKQMPEVLIENMKDDMYHEEKSKEKKKWR